MKRTILTVAGVAFCWLTPWAAAQTAPASKPALPFTIAKDTTLLTEPLKPDGSVDYITAVNRQLSQGVTPLNNAFVALLPAVGNTENTFGSSARDVMKLVGVSDLQPLPGTWTPFSDNAADSDAQQAALRALTASQSAPWNPAEHPDWVRWIAANQQTLNTFRAAAERPRFWAPLVPDKSGLLIAALSPVTGVSYRGITECMRLQAMCQPVNPSAAWPDLLACHKFSGLLAQDSDITYLLLAVAIDRNTSATDAALIADGKTDNSLLKKMLIDLSALPPFPTMGDVYRRKGIYYFPDSVQNLALTFDSELAKAGTPEQVAALRKTLADLGIPSPDWDRTLRFGNPLFEDLCTNRTYPSAAAYLEAGRDREHRDDQLGESARAGAPAGAEFDRPGDYLFIPRTGDTRATYSDRIAAGTAAMLIPSFGRGQARVSDAAKARELTILACALELHHRATGRYPDSLAALAPQYVAKIPSDYYGRPLTYSHTETGFHLASLGMENDTPEEAAKHRYSLGVDISHNPK